MVMANVQTLLENADTPDLLNSVVNVILHIAKNYPNVFTSHFRVGLLSDPMYMEFFNGIFRIIIEFMKIIIRSFVHLVF